MQYEVHLRPPKYPEKCRPSLCRHEPQFVMAAEVHIVKTRGRKSIEIDHSVCLACGLPQPCTVGGNVLVDLQMLWQRFGFHADVGARILYLRDKWARIATYLFEDDGWNGRHERLARLIDPLLTMKLRLEAIEGSTDVRMGLITFDPSQWRGVE